MHPSVAKISMEQNTPEWLAWRRAGIGASDASIIMGLSPWKTPYELWREKSGLITEEFSGNYATNHGKTYESVARKKIEEVLDIKISPACLEGDIDGVPWKCSLDGATNDFSTIVEIKCPLKLWRPLSEIPQAYLPQVQHQIFGVRPKKMYYAEYFKREDKLEIIEVHADEPFQESLMASEKTFWDRVTGKNPPDEDIKNMNSDSKWVDVLSKYGKRLELMDALKKEIDDMHEEIEKMFEGVKAPKALASGFICRVTKRAGSVDYSKIPELKDVNLENYRKKGTEYFEVRRSSRK